MISPRAFWPLLGNRTPATRKLRESIGAARPPFLEGPALGTPLQGCSGAPWLVRKLR